MELSIIILNYNTFELTCQCIESVIEHTNNISYEIVVVDNGSSECEPEHFLDKYPSIKLIPSKENLGFSKGNNLGIMYAIGTYILLLNSDTIIVDNGVGKSLSRIKESEEIGVLTCKLVFPDGTIQHQCRRFETIRLFLIEKLRIHKLLPKGSRAKLLLGGYFDHLQEMFVDRVWGTFFLFNRNILEAFPEKKLADQFFMYGEDNEWCYQVRVFAKKRILYFPDATVIHLMGGSKYGREISKEKMETMELNRRVYMNRYYGKLKTSFLDFLKKTI